MPSPALVSALARSLMAGEPTVEAIEQRAARTLGRGWRWLSPFAHRYADSFAKRTRPRHSEVIQFLLADSGFRRAHRKLTLAEWLVEPPRMLPAAAASDWDLPVIETPGDLARWLSIHPAHLEWFADLKGLCTKTASPRLQHYHYRLLEKRSGGLRLIECPKPELKELQRWILSRLLDRIPAHPAAHGFVKGRSAVTYASPHCAKPVVLRLDLDNFFPAFPAARIDAVFRTLGYPEAVAARLAGICCNAAPRSIWRSHPAEAREMHERYGKPHLPQGAPASPALANIAAYHLDCRLTGLARSAGAIYTRYADDLAFSGGEEFARGVERFAIHAAAIALEEGFDVNHHKTKIMRSGARQSLAGIVINRHPNVRRAGLEQLEAILTNCVRFGPQSQNRAALPDFRAHLEGRIGWVEMVNRDKGRKLRRIFHAIDFGG